MFFCIPTGGLEPCKLQPARDGSIKTIETIDLLYKGKKRHTIDS